MPPAVVRFCRCWVAAHPATPHPCTAALRLQERYQNQPEYIFGFFDLAPYGIPYAVSCSQGALPPPCLGWQARRPAAGTTCAGQRPGCWHVLRMAVAPPCIAWPCMVCLAPGRRRHPAAAGTPPALPALSKASAKAATQFPALPSPPSPSPALQCWGFAFILMFSK
jgi:hypothetical protein